MEMIITLCAATGAMIILGLIVTFISMGVVLGVISLMEVVEDIIKRRKGRK